jgi:N-acetylglutamate synthase-like GNAT family acetyltransferase
MTSGEAKTPLRLKKALLTDIDGIKKVVDTLKHELGFVTRPALIESIYRREVYIAVMDGEIVGIIHYRHRKDGQTTLYHLGVAKSQRYLGIGRRLVAAMQRDAKRIGQSSLLLKCPVDLPASQFYQALGFELLAVEDGKTRKLQVWRKMLTDAIN